MADRKNKNAGNGVADETPATLVASDAPPADAATPADDGFRDPPYDAAWVTIRDAATIAGVTAQTVRNAYVDHAAFNTPGTPADGDTPATEPIAHWFRTKMKDNFGNVTDYDVVYLDKAAVDRWVIARADKPAGAAHGGAKRRIVRLTEEQIAAQPVMTLADGSQVPAVMLADGVTLVALEVPPMGNRKSKSDEAAPADASATAEVPADAGDSAADAGASLFDVALTEDEAAPVA